MGPNPSRIRVPISDEAVGMGPPVWRASRVWAVVASTREGAGAAVLADPAEARSVGLGWWLH
jgi:hypothetical protein